MFHEKLVKNYRKIMLNNISSILKRLVSKNTIVYNCRTICTTSERSFFFESDDKKGYPRLSDVRDEAKTPWQKMCQGWKILLEELALWKEEVKDYLHFDPITILREGEVDVQWRFEGDPSILDQWVVTADSDYGEGNSTASIQLSKTGRGIFMGNLDARHFIDGRIKRTGYCNMRSVRVRKSFHRTAHLPWGPYSHLVMRVRGDGRNYLLILASPGAWDILWNDSYQYILHTRGGPYWQYVRIPFSKFFLVSAGRIQDTQQPPPLANILTFGITAADKINGNFKLEIDYIGVECDPSHSEEHAYEMYRTPHKFHI
ncbi:complex I intermediate-associated protein 30, mitochondrial [Venturia canescens]|uniref:complex I intermediate-associated protein 30, mitochondrial n=1 Tax=Venturia canescens TaxID=32260 RepID=UPI001C9BE225|nr:complex I intermediate-associated protein 30, mitochondrial [Venturia canescens]